MSREDFLQFLARAVADGLLNEADAVALLVDFDAGRLDPDWQLPRVPEQSQGLDEAAAALALLALLALLKQQQIRTPPILPAQAARLGPVLPTVAPVRILRGLGNTDRLITGLQEVYERQARGLATALAEGRITLAEWQLGMEGAIQSHLVQQTAVGGGSTVLTPRQWADVERRMAEQNAYLSRFADAMALRQGTGVPFSEAYIAARAESYGGVGRGLGYEEMEAAMLADGTLNGYAVYYVSRDDSATCTACLQADRGSPYMPGTPHPVPGQICLGRNRCRCRLEYRYAPEEARRLGVTV